MGKFHDVCYLCVVDHVCLHFLVCPICLPVVEVDDLVEEKCPASSAREPGADQFGPVGQDGVAGGAGEKARAPDVSQEYATHFLSRFARFCKQSLSIFDS